MLQLQVQLWLIRLLFEDLSRVGVLVAMIALVGLRVMVWEVLMQQNGWEMKMWFESLVQVVVELNSRLIAVSFKMLLNLIKQ